MTAVRFPQAGARVRVPGWGAVGVTYRGQSQLDLELDAHLEGIVEFAGIDVPLLYELEAKTIASFTPHQDAFGASFQRIEGLHLNFDLTWMNWSAYVSPTAKLRALLEVQPPPGTPVELPEEPAPTAIVPPAFEDRFVPRLGAEYRIGAWGPLRAVHGHRQPKRLVEVPVRLGYAYEHSPVPSQSAGTNFVDADRHTVTGGVGVAIHAPSEELGGSLKLDLHGALSVLPERVTVKDNPADFVGDYRARGEMFGVGATMGVVF